VKLEVQLDAEAVGRGETLTGRVLVLEGGEARSLTLTVSLRERSPGYVEPVSESGDVLHRGRLATGQSIEFRCGVAEDAPPSVKGNHGELFWQLEVVSDQPGLDTRVSRVFLVRS
jgi:hypothetical protein